MSTIYILRDKRTFMFLFSYSLLIWLIEILFYAGISQSTGLLPTVKDSIAAAALIVPIVNIALIFPSSPSGLGVYELAIILSLDVFNIDASQALNYSIICHSILFVSATLPGLYILLTDNLGRKSIKVNRNY